MDGEEDLSIFLSRNIAVLSVYGSKFNKFNEFIYSQLYNHSLAAYDFYKIPPSKVVELGVRQKFKILTKSKFLTGDKQS